MQEREAHDALEQAQVLERKVRHHGIWMATYCVLYSTVSFVLVLTVGLFPGTPTFMMMAVFFVLVVALVVWASTRPVTPRHFVRLHTTMILSWTVCYTLGLLIGRLYFMENPTWWFLAATATVLPGLIVALVSLRQSRSAL